MAKLITIRGPKAGQELELAELCLFGRSPNCQIYISDLTVSREHARVSRTKAGWLLEDLGSGNGTYVNEERIVQHLLHHGDEIRVSTCTYRFEAAEESQNARWVNMVTVIAGAEPGLVNTVTQARITMPPIGEETNEADLRLDLARTHRMLETLYAVTDATATILEPKELFTQILDYLFNIFPDADRGFVMTLDSNSQLIPAAIRRRRGEGFTGGLVVSQTVVGQVLQQGQSVLSVGDLRKTGSATRMCAPLAAQGKTFGILLIEGRPDGRAFTQEDLDLLSGIASQAGIAYLNAHMHQQLLRQQRLEQDLLFARQIQQSFLPLEPPEVPGFQFARRYNPVFDVGGDFYDFIPLPGGDIGILIGDVSGKGVSDALLMARLTSDMRYFAISERSPARVLARANASLARSTQDNMFATVLYAVLEVNRRVLTLSNAGHIPPLLRQATGAVHEIDEGTNLALGVLADAKFDEFGLELRSGDSVVLCTDGVVEAKNDQQEEFGFARLQRCLTSGNGAQAILDLVLRDLQRHTGSSPQYDDISIVAFTRTG